MDLGLRGKRVLVTGGTKSIGRAIVEAFLAEGAVVGFCARDRQLVEEREKDWRSKQGRVSGTALDVTDDDALRKWIDGHAGDGGIDHFVANVSALGTENTRDGERRAIDVAQGGVNMVSPGTILKEGNTWGASVMPAPKDTSACWSATRWAAWERPTKWRPLSSSLPARRPPSSAVSTSSSMAR